jgi:translocation and assembly module TamB
MRPRLARVTLWVVAALVLVMAAGVAVVRTPWFRDWLRHLVVRQATAAINGTVEVGGISGSLFRDVTLHGVVVSQGGRPTLEIPALSARYDVVQMLFGRMAVDELILFNPSISIVQERDGWNIARLIRTRQQGPEEAPRSLAIGQIRVVDGRASVQQAGSRVRSFDDVTVDASMRLASPNLTLSVGRLSARDLATGLAVDAAGELSKDDQGISLPRFEITTPASHLSGRLQYEGSFNRRRVEARLDATRLHLREFAAYLPSAMPADVDLSGHLTMAGRLDAMVAEWDLESTAGQTSGQARLSMHRPILGIDTTLRVENLNLRHLVRRPDLDDRLTAQATFRGDINMTAPGQSRGSFSIAANAVALLGYRASQVAARGSLEKGIVRARGSGIAYGASATFDATARGIRRGRPIDIDVAGVVRRLNLERLPRQTRAPVVSTDLSGAYTVTAGGGDWRVTFTADDSRVADAAIAAGTVATAESRGGRLTAEVVGQVRNVSEAMLRLSTPRTTSLGGTVHARVEMLDPSAPFSLDRLEGSIVADLAGSTVDGDVLDRANVDASLAAGVLDVRRLELTSGAIVLTATGAAAVGDDAEGTSDLAYVIDVSDLSMLARFGVAPLAGAAHVEGRLQGPADRLAATGTLQLRQVRYAAAAEALAINGKYDVVVPERQLARATATVEAESTFLTIRGQEIQRLTVVSRYEGQRLDLKGRVEQPGRTVDVDGALLLLPDAREVRIRQLTVAAQGDPWLLAPGSEAVLRYDERTLAARDVVFTRGPERVDASGTVVFTEGSGESDFRVGLTNLSVGDLYTMATGNARVVGTASGDLRITGVLPDPVVTGQISIANGSVADVPFTAVAAEIGLRQRLLSVNARIEEASGHAFTLVGTVPTRADAGPLDVKAESRQVSLGLIQAFTSHVDTVQGLAAVSLHATGSLANPALTGSLTLSNGSLRIVPTGVIYSAINADVGIENGRASIRQFTLSDAEGHTLTASGGGDIPRLTTTDAVDVVVKSTGLTVLENELGEIEVAGDARVEGTVAAPRVTGRLEVSRGLLEVDEMLRVLTAGSRAPASPLEAVPEPGRSADVGVPESEPATPAPPDTGVFSRATLALQVDMPDDVVLRGRGIRPAAGSVALGSLNLTVGGDLEIRKSAGEQPVLIGSVEAVRGFYDFQGRRFEVQRGSSVVFRGTRPIDPSVDVTGQREVSGITVAVRLGGTARRPTIALSSSPPLDQSDILSLIVFNQPINELGEAEQTDLLQRAGDLAASAIATPVADSIARALDVDLFEIRTPVAGGAGEVSIGRQVNERLFVGFRQEFGDADASRLSFEYRLTDALRVMTSLAQGADRTKRTRERETAGVDLIYLLRY